VRWLKRCNEVCRLCLLSCTFVLVSRSLRKRIWFVCSWPPPRHLRLRCGPRNSLTRVEESRRSHFLQWRLVKVIINTAIRKSFNIAGGERQTLRSWRRNSRAARRAGASPGPHAHGPLRGAGLGWATGCRGRSRDPGPGWPLSGHGGSRSRDGCGRCCAARAARRGSSGAGRVPAETCRCRKRLLPLLGWLPTKGCVALSTSWGTFPARAVSAFTVASSLLSFEIFFF